MNDELCELVKSIRNRCDLIQYIIESQKLEHTLFTICEDLYEDAQAMIDNFCIEEVPL